MGSGKLWSQGRTCRGCWAAEAECFQAFEQRFDRRHSGDRIDRCNSRCCSDPIAPRHPPRDPRRERNDGEQPQRAETLVRFVTAHAPALEAEAQPGQEIGGRSPRRFGFRFRGEPAGRRRIDFAPATVDPRKRPCVRVTRAHDELPLDRTPFLDDVAGRVPRGNSGRTQEQRRRGSEVFAVAAAVIQQEVLERAPAAVG